MPGLEPSAHFACRTRLPPDDQWELAFVFSSTSYERVSSGSLSTGYFASLESWTTSWVNLEVRDDVTVEMELTKLHGDGVIATAVPHPGRAVVSVQGGKALITLVGTQQFMLDIDGALDAAPTGSSALHPSRKTVVHTFSVFANPLLTDAERPDPADPDVRVVAPGESPPADFQETTLYFAPGVHNLSLVPECCSTSDPSAACQCVNDNAGPSYPGYVAPFPVRSGKRLYLPADAWLDGWLLSEASWGIDGANITGYGVLSGRRMRWKEGDHLSCRAIQLRGATNCHLVGPTLVDFPNHHLILVGDSSSSGLAAPNTLRHVKIFGWRTNGDGIHIWGHWNEVTDLFLRTQAQRRRPDSPDLPSRPPTGASPRAGRLCVRWRRGI